MAGNYDSFNTDLKGSSAKSGGRTERQRFINRYYNRRLAVFKRAGFSNKEAEFAARQGYKLTDPTVRKILENRKECVSAFMKAGYTRKGAIKELARQLTIKLRNRKIKGLNLFLELSP